MSRHELLISSRLASCLWSLHKPPGLEYGAVHSNFISFSREMVHDSLESSGFKRRKYRRKEEMREKGKSNIINEGSRKGRLAEYEEPSVML